MEDARNEIILRLLQSPTSDIDDTMRTIAIVAFGGPEGLVSYACADVRSRHQALLTNLNERLVAIRNSVLSKEGSDRAVLKITVARIFDALRVIEEHVLDNCNSGTPNRVEQCYVSFEVDV